MPNLFASICAVLLVAIGEGFSHPGAPWPESSPAKTGALLLGVPILTWAIGRWLARRAVLTAMTRGEGAARNALRRGRWIVHFTTLALFGLLILSGDWIATVHAWIPAQIPVAAHLVALLPYLVTALLGLSAIARGEHFLGPQGDEPAPRLTLLTQEWRPLILPVVPYLILSGILDLRWYFPDAHVVLETDPVVAALFMVVVLLLILMASPLVVRCIFPAERLPDGPFRVSLEELARRAGIGYRDILVWKTGGRELINACIAGAFSPMRYIFFTDGILKHFTPRELGAVFAHELGHARHHHFVIFFAVVVAFLFGVHYFGGAVEPGAGFWAVLAVAAFLYFRAGFGVLSRQLESQADLYSADLVRSTQTTTLALSRVGELTGGVSVRRGWRHHPIPTRVDILWRAAVDPGFRRRFDRRTRIYLRVVALLFVVATCGFIASFLGAAEVSEEHRLVIRGRALLEDFAEHRDRPWASPARDEKVLRSAERCFIEAYDLARRRGADELAAESLQRLSLTYGFLEERWSEATTRALLLMRGWPAPPSVEQRPSARDDDRGR